MAPMTVTDWIVWLFPYHPLPALPVFYYFAIFQSVLFAFPPFYAPLSVSLIFNFLHFHETHVAHTEFTLTHTHSTHFVLYILHGDAVCHHLMPLSVD